MEFVRQLKNLDVNYNAADAGDDQFISLNNFKRNQRKEIKIFSRKFNSIIKDCKLSRKES